MQKLKIGIIGLGFVGSAMIQSFTLKGCNIYATFDKYKNGGIGNLENRINAITRESYLQYRNLHNPC